MTLFEGAHHEVGGEARHLRSNVSVTHEMGSIADSKLRLAPVLGTMSDARHLLQRYPRSGTFLRRRRGLYLGSAECYSYDTNFRVSVSKCTKADSDYRENVLG